MFKCLKTIGIFASLALLAFGFEFSFGSVFAVICLFPHEPGAGSPVKVVLVHHDASSQIFKQNCSIETPNSGLLSGKNEELSHRRVSGFELKFCGDKNRPGIVQVSQI